MYELTDENRPLLYIVKNRRLNYLFVAKFKINSSKKSTCTYACFKSEHFLKYNVISCDTQRLILVWQHLPPHAVFLQLEYLSILVSLR